MPKEFSPVSGLACSKMLGNAVDSERVWRLIAIETLADGPAVALGDIWRAVQLGPVMITNSRLCAILELATQVINLDVSLVDDESTELVIDDGLLIICRLPCP